MTDDLETMRDMLKRAKIEFTEHDGATHGGRTIIVTRGYFGFFSKICFDKNGALADLAAFE